MQKIAEKLFGSYKNSIFDLKIVLLKCTSHDPSPNVVYNNFNSVSCRNKAIHLHKT